MHKWLVRSVIGLVVLLIPWYFVTSQQQTMQQMFHQVWDRVNHRFMFAEWGGPSAQDSQETLQTMFKDVFDADGNFFRASVANSDILRGTTPPATCDGGQTMFVFTTTGAVCICNATGDGFICGEGGEAVNIALDDLTDVEMVVTPPADGRVLTWVGDASTGEATFLAPATGVSSLDALLDVNIITPATGEVLTYDLPTEKWLASPLPAIAVDLNGLTDVDLVTVPPNDQQVLTYTTSTGLWTAKIIPGALPAIALDDLTDVTLGTPTNGQGLLFDSADSKWKATSIPGLGSIVTAEALRLTPVTETTTCTMTASSIHHISPTGTTTCTLPAASDTAKPGYYELYNMNTNSLVVAPTGADLINGSNTALAAIQGPNANFTCRVVSTSKWQCSVTTIGGYGSPMTTLCPNVGGGTNDSSIGSAAFIAHTSTCTIPSAKLTVGSVVEHCTGWHVVTGTAPGTLSLRWMFGTDQLNATAFANAPMVSVARNFQTCMTAIVGEAPSATADVLTTVTATLDSTDTNASGSGSTTQPVTSVNTSGTVVVSEESRWSAAGTGPNTIKKLYSVTKVSGLLP